MSVAAKDIKAALLQLIHEDQDIFRALCEDFLFSNLF